MTRKSNSALKFLIFDVVSSPKPITMALNVQKIKEVVENQGLSSLPDAIENILGVHNLRGTPIPVFDVFRIVSKGGSPYEMRPDSRILICDLQNVLIGFPVAKTGRIISCPSSDFLAPPKGGVIAGKKLISGMIHKEESYIPVLDLDSILEMLDPDLSDEDSRKGETGPASFSGKKVLLVEDSRLILKKLVRIFTEMGFDIATAENGEDGLKLCGKSSHYDLIFTDIEMPLLDGISMVRKIKEQPQYSNTPVLFNSALSNPALITDIEREKLGRYIVKYDRDLILSEVAAALKKTAA